ncbi:CLUMA_CG000932, isoform A [Clunio marinus]|uniref:CLUMA_CG000932, isoform A n=1 Tax=Clunio marinus TaxID=568069 RepID=A0A1J1HG97_9DIPT|nr:CLUMA_CG000932, isoform A [Clunio marinus]
MKYDFTFKYDTNVKEKNLTFECRRKFASIDNPTSQLVKKMRVLFFVSLMFFFLSTVSPQATTRMTFL